MFWALPSACITKTCSATGDYPTPLLLPRSLLLPRNSPHDVVIVDGYGSTCFSQRHPMAFWTPLLTAASALHSSPLLIQRDTSFQSHRSRSHQLGHNFSPHLDWRLCFRRLFWFGFHRAHLRLSLVG